MISREELSGRLQTVKNAVTDAVFNAIRLLEIAMAEKKEQSVSDAVQEATRQAINSLLPYVSVNQKKKCTAYLEKAFISMLACWKEIDPENSAEKRGAKKRGIFSFFPNIILYAMGELPDQDGVYEKFLASYKAGEKVSLPSLDTLQVIESFSLDVFTWPNDPLTNKLSQKLELPAIGAGAFDLVTESRDGKPARTAYTVITFDEDNTTLRFQGGRLDEYSRLVLGAIVSLWREAEKRGTVKAFTTPTIFRQLPGGNDKPTKQQREAVEAAIEKLRRLRVYIDLTDEIRRRGLKVTGSGVYDDHLINAVAGPYVTRNGKETVRAFEILSEPFPLKYSRITGQLLSADTGYLEVREVIQGQPGQLIRMSPERQALTGYLLRRILVMKHDAKSKCPKQSNKILFNTLFDAAGIPASVDRRQMADYRSFCFQILEYWKSMGLIKDYKAEQKGRKYTGIVICL